MNIIILGKGYVGNHLFNTLSEHSGRYGERPNVQIFSKEELDYTDETCLMEEINVMDDTYIINCSGFTGRPNVDEGENKKEECWKYNVQVPLNLNKVCNETGAEIIHITSGCIYTGYEKEWEEDDTPNFGIYSNEASFYSKSKHAFETLSDTGLHLRIRMPFCDTMHERSVLTKIYNYDNLVDTINSKTYIPELCNFIQHYIKEGYKGYETIHFVNKEPISTKEIVEKMKAAGIENPNWKWKEMDQLGMKANRSNCILDTTRLEQQYNFNISSEYTALDRALEKMTS